MCFYFFSSRFGTYSVPVNGTGASTPGTSGGASSLAETITTEFLTDGISLTEDELDQLSPVEKYEIQSMLDEGSSLLEPWNLDNFEVRESNPGDSTLKKERTASSSSTVLMETEGKVLGKDVYNMKVLAPVEIRFTNCFPLDPKTAEISKQLSQDGPNGMMDLVKQKVVEGLTDIPSIFAADRVAIEVLPIVTFGPYIKAPPAVAPG